MNIRSTKIARERFLHSEEGSLFAIGCCMLILWIETIAALWRTSHELWLGMLTMGFTHIVAGRAASIAQATQLALPAPLIVLLATYFDTMTVFVMFPVLVFSYKNFLERRFFRKHMQPVFESARKGMGYLGRFKIVGVFLFVWFPFWMTGIISGSVLGFLIGLKTWVNMVTVILGSVTAEICWVFAYDRLFSWLGGVHQAIPVAVSLIIIGGLVVGRVMRGRRKRASRG